ncbi:trans-sulfuration enzyme family protein [Adhaeribacter soli]|uniref:Aminotransferase class I/II-fold pyridoxal phosphate-dependent enzyme n=1 Tax=Adhaeribacter soli TaxID=2607655 RepID=A0A5N1IKX0_9BACT|nr:aminotransferase class I/II-fold pyridoxal phosphate-dependent enzyme [Adhaeribacter soli]KAA9327334.1 aminotransferase class I/II-fold pyridoxal phosphate-dependent enzyme [Adhaeribacter soli]
MDLSYILNELGEDRELYFNSVAPPIIQTSNFSCKTVDALRNALQHESEVDFYTRGNNPTTDLLEKKVAALEGTEHALAFGSGIAAVSAAVMSQISAGDHIVTVAKPYSWTNTLMKKYLPRFGVEVTFVDGRDAANYEKAIKPNTKVFYLESPNSFTFELQDIAAVCAIAKRNNIVTIIDNSYATPLFQSPIALGVDIVVHAATKYISGHSDTMGGIICSTHETITKIFEAEFMTLGGIISPFNSWLLLRGLRTLPVRMERIAATTRQVVDYLVNHPKVQRVFFPFLPTDPQYELAMRQMRNNSGQFTIQLKTESIQEIDLFCDSLQHFLMAASWGGHESLIYPTAASYNSGNYKSELPVNLIRFYIGLEDPEYLISDLEQAFSKI